MEVPKWADRAGDEELPRRVDEAYHFVTCVRIVVDRNLSYPDA